jgi:hypothetical protein
LADKAANNYRSAYLSLMTSVPEFALWSGQVDHAATHAALGRLEQALLLGPERPARDLRAIVATINQGELNRPIVDVDTDGYGLSAVFPPVGEIFVSPYYMLNENVHSDLDLLLARHFTSAESTIHPMLLLGHPGAGKSLLMKVLAAKLSPSTYTVVRVPLRAVEANAPVRTQIDQALNISTGGRASWADLADSGADTIRVVLLDGLDELLQATSQDRHGYLHEVREFQRVEALVGSPVAAIVTSRTLVADRVSVPEQTPVISLEAFDEAQIGTWLDRWNRFNADSPTRPMPLDVALAQREITSQPLLLLMLTLYFADPDVEVRTDLSTSELYSRLLDNYARREVTKQAGRPLRPERLRQGTRDQVRRLSIAALGMFNRGRQSITERQLSADLEALGEKTATGERVLGEFFFVHAAEAKGPLSTRDASGVVTHRTYEFLHATFAEYLVAAQLVSTVAQVATTVAKDGTRPRPDDDLLFALLCHQSIAIQQPVLTFVRAHYSTCSQRERRAAAWILNLLISGYRNRPMSRHFAEYRPTSRDHLRALATYAANLLLLRVVASPGHPVRLSDLWPDEDGMSQWRSCVALWQAGMDESGYRSTLGVFWQDNGVLTELRRQLSTEYAYEIHRSALRDEMPAARTLALGHTVLSRNAALPPSWYLKTSPEQDITMTLSVLRELPVVKWPDLDVLNNRSHLDSRAVEEIWTLLCRKAGHWPQGTAFQLAAIAMGHPEFSGVTELQAGAAFRHREVYNLLRDRGTKFYGKASKIYRLAMARHDRVMITGGRDAIQKLEDVISVLLPDNGRITG